VFFVSFDNVNDSEIFKPLEVRGGATDDEEAKKARSEEIDKLRDDNFVFFLPTKNEFLSLETSEFTRVMKGLQTLKERAKGFGIPVFVNIITTEKIDFSSDASLRVQVPEFSDDVIQRAIQHLEKRGSDIQDLTAFVKGHRVAARPEYSNPDFKREKWKEAILYVEGKMEKGGFTFPVSITGYDMETRFESDGTCLIDFTNPDWKNELKKILESRGDVVESMLQIAKENNVSVEVDWKSDIDLDAWSSAIEYVADIVRRIKASVYAEKIEGRQIIISNEKVGDSKFFEINNRQFRVSLIAKEWQRMLNEFIGREGIVFNDEPLISESTPDLPATPEAEDGEPSWRAGMETRAHDDHPQRNEDSTIVDLENGVFAVFDGAGGHRRTNIGDGTSIGGEYASDFVQVSVVRNLAVLPDNMTPEQLKDALVDIVRSANTELYEEQSTEKIKLITTATVLKLWESLDGQEKKAIIAHVGDSRVYRYRDGAIELFTFDDNLGMNLVANNFPGAVSLVRDVLDRGEEISKSLIAQIEEQKVYNGMSWEEIEVIIRGQFGSRVTQMVGNVANVRVQSLVLDAQDGDKFLVCGDGIHDNLTRPEILQAFEEGGDDPQAVAKLLVEHSHHRSLKNNRTVLRGKPDDMTAVVVDILGEKIPSPVLEPNGGLDGTAVIADQENDEEREQREKEKREKIMEDALYIAWLSAKQEIGLKTDDEVRKSGKTKSKLFAEVMKRSIPDAFKKHFVTLGGDDDPYYFAIDVETSSNSIPSDKKEVFAVYNPYSSVHDVVSLYPIFVPKDGGYILTSEVGTIPEVAIVSPARIEIVPVQGGGYRLPLASEYTKIITTGKLPGGGGSNEDPGYPRVDIASRLTELKSEIIALDPAFQAFYDVADIVTQVGGGDNFVDSSADQNFDVPDVDDAGSNDEDALVSESDPKRDMSINKFIISQYAPYLNFDVVSDTDIGTFTPEVIKEVADILTEELGRMSEEDVEKVLEIMSSFSYGRTLSESISIHVKGYENKDTQEKAEPDINKIRRDLQRAKYVHDLPLDEREELDNRATEMGDTLHEWTSQSSSRMDTGRKLDQIGDICRSSMMWDLVKYDALANGGIKIENSKDGKKVVKNIGELLADKTVESFGITSLSSADEINQLTEVQLGAIIDKFYFDVRPIGNSLDALLRRRLSVQRMVDWFLGDDPSKREGGLLPVDTAPDQSGEDQGEPRIVGDFAYYGFAEDGPLTGQGKIVYTPTGDTFIGSVVDGTIGTTGRMDYANGGYDEGTWGNGYLVEGTAKYTLADGNTYEGEVVASDDRFYIVPNGHGKRTNTDGSVQEGEWVMGDFQENLPNSDDSTLLEIKPDLGGSFPDDLPRIYPIDLNSDSSTNTGDTANHSLTRPAEPLTVPEQRTVVEADITGVSKSVELKEKIEGPIDARVTKDFLEKINKAKENILTIVPDIDFKKLSYDGILEVEKICVPLIGYDKEKLRADFEKSGKRMNGRQTLTERIQDVFVEPFDQQEIAEFRFELQRALFEINLGEEKKKALKSQAQELAKDVKEWTGGRSSNSHITALSEGTGYEDAIYFDLVGTLEISNKKLSAPETGDRREVVSTLQEITGKPRFLDSGQGQNKGKKGKGTKSEKPKDLKDWGIDFSSDDEKVLKQKVQDLQPHQLFVLSKLVRLIGDPSEDTAKGLLIRRLSGQALKDWCRDDAVQKDEERRTGRDQKRFMHRALKNEDQTKHLNVVDTKTTTTTNSKYTGAINENSKPHGRGKEVTSDTYFRDGEWEDGNFKSGTGYIDLADGKYIKGRWWNFNFVEGEGKLKIGDAQYEGQIHCVDNIYRPHGSGTWKSGNEEYTGGFVDGKRHGHGTLKKNSDETFVGWFRDGKLEGDCKRISRDNVEVWGEMKNNVFDQRREEVKKAEEIPNEFVDTRDTAVENFKALSETLPKEGIRGFLAKHVDAFKTSLIEKRAEQVSPVSAPKSRKRLVKTALKKSLKDWWEGYAQDPLPHKNSFILFRTIAWGIDTLKRNKFVSIPMLYGQEDPFYFVPAKKKIKEIKSNEVGSIHIMYEDGTEFVGNTDDLMRPSGEGQMKRKDGTIWKGNFDEGLPHDQQGMCAKVDALGVVKSEKQEPYMLGSWYRGPRDQRGEAHTTGNETALFRRADGSRYEGGFSHGQYSGRGKEIGADGSILEGTFFLGRPHGVMSVTGEDGKKSQVMYENGVRGEKIFHTVKAPRDRQSYTCKTPMLGGKTCVVVGEPEKRRNISRWVSSKERTERDKKFSGRHLVYSRDAKMMYDGTLDKDVAERGYGEIYDKDLGVVYKGPISGDGKAETKPVFVDPIFWSNVGAVVSLGIFAHRRSRKGDLIDVNTGLLEYKGGVSTDDTGKPIPKGKGKGVKLIYTENGELFGEYRGKMKDGEPTDGGKITLTDGRKRSWGDAKHLL